MGTRGTSRCFAVLFLLVVAVISSPAQRIIANVPVGNNPHYVAVNPVTNKIFVGNQGANTVSVVDGATFSTSSVPVYDPLYIVVNDQTNKTYVATNSQFPAIVVIDGATLAVTTLFTGDNIGNGPKVLAVNKTTNKIYAITTRNKLVIMDGATEAVTTVPMGGTAFPGSIAVNPVTNKIYVTNELDGNVAVIDGATNDVIARVPTGLTPDAVEVNTSTNRIYVANIRDNTVSVLDGTNDKVIATIPVQVSYYGGGVAINQLTNRINLAGYQKFMTQIAGESNSPIGQAAIGAGAFMLVSDDSANALFVNNPGDSTVTFINGETMFSFDVLLGAFPSSIAVDPVRKRLYATIQGQSTLTVIDGNDPLTVSTSGAGTVRSSDGQINCGSNCSHNYAWGTSVVTLWAQPNPGNTFIGWSGCDSVQQLTCQVRVKDAQTVNATFAAANVTLTSLSLNPSTLRGGQMSIATLSLSQPAPPGGVTVALVTDQPNVIIPPPTLYIPGGTLKAQFSVRTVPVRNKIVGQITAVAGPSHVSATLTVQP